MELTKDQRSPEWFEARKGRITASQFDLVMKLPRAKRDIEAGVLTDGQMTYAFEKVAEMLVDAEGTDNAAMARGRVLESEAKSGYAFTFQFYRRCVEREEPVFVA